MKSFIYYLIPCLLLVGCSDQDEPVVRPQFENYSFDAGLDQWENITVNSELYKSHDWNVVDGKAITTDSLRSRILMQGDFPKGTYTVEISVNNSSPVDTEVENVELSLYNICPTGTYIKGKQTISQGESVKTFQFVLDENFNMIGFRVARNDSGYELNVEVTEIKITDYKDK